MASPSSHQACQSVTPTVHVSLPLESFAKLLTAERSQDSLQSQDATKKSLKKLKELSQLFCLDEGATVQSHSRSDSVREDASSTHRSMRGGRDHSTRPTRRVLSDDRDDEEDRNTWGLSSLGPSGKLPGVYQNVRFLCRQYQMLCCCGRASKLMPAIVPLGTAISIFSYHLRVTRPAHPRSPPIQPHITHRRSDPYS